MNARQGNLLVLQSGGPTPVLNTSLCAVIEEAVRTPTVSKILGACHGIEGLVHGKFVDLSGISSAELSRIRLSPGASLGTSRYKPSDADLQKILAYLRRLDVRWMVLIGGNGSLRAADAIGNAARDAGQDLCVIGIPKTIDNDIPLTDRCPGYGSAARYVAQSVRDLGQDVRALPQPVSIFETMGRGVGWLAAASVLAKRDEGDAPHLIYLPEKPFEINRFLADVDRIVTRHGYAVAVVNEGIRNADGSAVHESADPSQRDACDRPLPGGVAAYLAGVVTQNLKVRCRSEKPGLCGRASMLHVSQQDRQDADLVGRAAVRTAVAGHHGKMISLRPLPATDEGFDLIALFDAAGKERPIPNEWLNNSDIMVAPEFIRYASRIVGDLIDYPSPLCNSAPSASVLNERLNTL